MKAPRLREIRDQRALSQRDLAKLAGVAPGTVVRLEANQDSHQVSIRKLAAALGVEPAALLAVPKGES